jgi:4-amino-4-deoxy-L-arabinose transferase-like glycosyltransferase
MASLCAVNAVPPAHRRSRVAGAALVLLLVLAAFVLLLWPIGAYPLTDGDAAFYGRVARNILDSGDWGVLRLDPASPGSDVDKPPLGIWMTAIAFRLLGPTDVAARLWHALVALGLLGLTAALAGRIAGRRAALYAAIVLLTSGQFFYQGREPMLDIPLATCVTAALWLMSGADARRVWPRFYAACAVAGLGVMIKGPVAAALLSVPAAMLIARARRQTEAGAPSVAARLLVGVAILLIIVLPWHVWMFRAGGASFADAYVGTLSWRRYLNPQFPPGLAVLPYALMVLAGLLPWAGLAVPALWVGWRDRRSEPALWFLTAFVLWTILFFGLSPGQIIMRYTLPAIPACAALIGVLLARPDARGLRAAALATIVIGVALALAGGLAARFDLGHRAAGPVVRTFLLLLAATMMVGGFLLRRFRLKSGLTALAAGASAAYVVLLILALPIVNDLYPERRMAAIINESDGRRARVAVFKASTVDSMLAFYLDARLEPLTTDEELERFLADHRPAWLLERAATPVPPSVRERLETVMTSERATLMRTRH